MRYLNKIIFINSATIRYGEIALDGNVHFIGTQGVGKSTVLRAILFFYNADTLKLGISREKKGFAEYYFPYANSYIVYEIVKENGPFCVFAFKSQGKVCFRFFDSAFRQEYFVGQDGVAFENADKIRAALDKAEVHLSRKIDRYEEYRDIIYGNNEGKKEFGKYSLLESRQYQNIPRTIQNVFLNSRLEAEFIKDTIIKSMNEEDVAVDLSIYGHHLKDFDNQLKDIQKLRNPAVLQQTQHVVMYYHGIRQKEREKLRLAELLGVSLRNAAESEPKILETIEKEESAQKKLQEKIEDHQNRFRVKRDKIKAEIEILKKKLDEAKEKEEAYEKKNIYDIISRVMEKPALEAETENLSREKELLSAKYASVVKKYEALIKELENQGNAVENSRISDKNALEAGFQNFRQKNTDDYQQLTDEIRKQNEDKLRDARESFEFNKNEIKKLELKKAEVRLKRFFEAELTLLEKNISSVKLRIQRSENDTITNKSQVETLRVQWELEKTARQQTHAIQKEKLDEKIQKLNTEILDIDFKLQNSKNSFYGWLNEKYAGWEQTVGKVIDEKILFRNDLSPVIREKNSKSIFGIDLDLNEIEPVIKTVADYENDKKTCAGQIEVLKKESANLDAALNNDFERLKTKYQGRIKSLKDRIIEDELESTKSKTSLDEFSIQLNDLHKKAVEEKRKTIEELDAKLLDLLDEEHKIRETIRTIEDQGAKLIKAKFKERDKKTEEALKMKIDGIAALDIEIKAAKKTFETRKSAIEKNKEKELTSKGADTVRLKAIDDRLAVLKQELGFIEDNRNLVVEYKKDKRELFDRVDDFRNHRQLQEQVLLQEEQKNAFQENNLKNSLDEVQQKIRYLNKEYDKIREDLDAFENFREKEPVRYMDIAESLSNSATEVKTTKRVKDLLDEIKSLQFNLFEKLNDLKKEINKFLGNFSAQNIFNFKTQINEDAEFMQFAFELNDFVEEDKLQEYEKRVNERYAGIIKLIGKETGDLTSREGEIQNVIQKINKDFEEKNFAGVIRKIEIRLQESSNTVVVTLKAIKKFNDENSFNLGETNLFSSNDRDTKNTKAIDLLKQLIKDIGEFKRDKITLSDSFDLQFRVLENQNDTGWVEKLSNVGSEGTDILVKAMINIMLLNVFKENASRRFKDFRLHCVMDEIGRLHPGNVRGILKFANDRNILLINGSPTENDALAYRHIFKLEKDQQSATRVKRILSQSQLAAV
jgi:hypothetical protein